MNFLKSIGYIELSIIMSFLILYSAYIFRIINIRKQIDVSLKNVFFKLILRTFYFSLMIISLLGPTFGVDKEEIKVIGKDIMISVDLSESMNANDIQPSRLEKIKFEMKKIIDEFSSDRIGIFMFSVPNSGTDFGPALELSLSKLSNDESKAQDSKSKVIILISDGEDFGDDTNSSITKIKESSIKLFTVGIGTEKGSKILNRDGSYKKDNKGIEVVSRLDSKSLQETAENTGGKYFEISDNTNQVEELISEIKNIKGEIIDSKVIDLTNNKYFYFLFSALILMLIDFTFSIKIISI